MIGTDVTGRLHRPSAGEAGPRRQTDRTTGDVQCHPLSPLTDLDLPRTLQICGNPSGSVHECPPVLPGHHPCGLAGADRATVPVAQESSDHGGQALPPPGFGGLPPWFAPLAQRDLRVPDEGPRIVTARADLPSRPHQLGDELRPEPIRDARVAGTPATTVDEDVPPVGGPLRAAAGPMHASAGAVLLRHDTSTVIIAQPAVRGVPTRHGPQGWGLPCGHVRRLPRP